MNEPASRPTDELRQVKRQLSEPYGECTSSIETTIQRKWLIADSEMARYAGLSVFYRDEWRDLETVWEDHK